MLFLNDIDEFTGYPNGDGTFHVDIQTWVTDKDGNKKQATISMQRVEIDNFEMCLLANETTWNIRLKEYINGTDYTI